MRWPGVVRSLGPRVHYQKYGLPDMDVYISRFEGRNTGLGSSAIQDSRRGFNGIRGGFGGLWSKSADRERFEARSSVATSGKIPTASPASP